MNTFLVCLIRFYPQNIRLFTSLIISKIALFLITEHLENTLGCIGSCILQLSMYDHMICWNRLSITEFKKTTHMF